MMYGPKLLLNHVMVYCYKHLAMLLIYGNRFEK